MSKGERLDVDICPGGGSKAYKGDIIDEHVQDLLSILVPLGDITHLYMHIRMSVSSKISLVLELERETGCAH